MIKSFEKINTSITVPKRGGKGRPKFVKEGMLHKYGATIAYVVVFDQAPMEKEEMDSSKDKWNEFRVSYNDLMKQNPDTSTGEKSANGCETWKSEAC